MLISLPGSLTWSADVSIFVEDQNGQPLQNVSVTGSWSGGDPATASCTSDLSGQCTVTDNGLSKSEKSVSFTVTSLSLAGYTYAPGDNHDLDGDSDGTTFLVSSSNRN